MSNINVPTGQDAYQAILMQKYAAAWNPFVRTVNRYMAGPPGAILALEAGLLVCMPQMPLRCGRRPGFVPVTGAAMQVTSSGGTGYAANDLVTFAPVNGGRPIVVKVVTVSAGAPVLITVVDPGSGLLGGGTGVSSLTQQTAALNQASTTGVGSGATWTAVIGVGQGLGANPRAEA